MSGMKEGDVSHQFRRHEGAGHSTQYLLSGQTARATHAEHTPQRPRSTRASTPLRGTYVESLDVESETVRLIQLLKLLQDQHAHLAPVSRCDTEQVGNLPRRW
jgi:hypothetical protein